MGDRKNNHNRSWKISGQYLESHIINAPKQKPFQIRVSRLTDDSKSDLLKNGTVWASYTEITDAKFSYPNSAVVGMRIDKSQYGDTPKRTYHIKGLIVQVLDNYDPKPAAITVYGRGGLSLHGQTIPHGFFTIW